MMYERGGVWKDVRYGELTKIYCCLNWLATGDIRLSCDSSSPVLRLAAFDSISSSN